MTAPETLILVVNHEPDEALNLKSLIEFMDSPAVSVATPADWQQRLGGKRLEALFVGADLTESEVDELLAGIRDLDPNVPIVMMNEVDRT
ncbi:MAG: hypothetical protein KJO82_13240 [Gammaproteobacteria bacterium]|nr:hypothetical protein [Gammaproteobacteria bacterium]